METNELPEDVKAKIGEAIGKVYQATAIRFPLRTIHQVHAEQAEAIAEIYRLGLQSCEEQLKNLNSLKLDAMYETVKLEEQLKAKDEEIARLTLRHRLPPMSMNGKPK